MQFELDNDDMKSLKRRSIYFISLVFILKMFIIWQTRKFVSWNCFVLTGILLANSDELNLILQKFTRPAYCLFFLSGFLAFFGSFASKQ